MRKQARPTGEEISGCYYICNYAVITLFLCLYFILILILNLGRTLLFPELLLLMLWSGQLFHLLPSLIKALTKRL
uniref:Uncharacterized protein n=1 Tax=Picea sitchensis TaxID=3332 RepID=A0A6B9XUC9_PICSI|nr:hypothetical protein Q903MT_gene3724 [Picea sitchensis]